MHASTIEPHLEQIGQRPTEIKVGLRTYDERGETDYRRNVLRLSLEDARELALALNYLVDLAE